ncbi:MAG: von Willebrand factor type domain [Gaiellaceae bacterium]|nr:von Willebrand factor type domain [Gaiellaceae bacterium]
MRGVPIGEAARLRPAARRTALIAAALAAVIGVAAVAVNVAARQGEPRRVSLLPPGDSVVVVLDLSLSIPEIAYTRMRNAMSELADSDASVGLVVFSDIAYEVLPTGSPAAELQPVLEYLTPVEGEVNDRTGGPLYATDPWSGGFRGGTRISVAIDRAREMIQREGGAGSLLLLSDLDTADADADPLGQALARVRQAKIPMRIVPLYPLEENYAYFASQLGREAFADWNRFFAAGGITERFEPPKAGPPVALVLAGAALLLLLGLNELRCRRLDLASAR